jgi:hypothetical protein
VKGNVFTAAVLMMMNDECDNNQDQNTIVSAFPDDSKMTDEQSWLSMHYAVAVTVENKISEEDIRILQAIQSISYAFI